MAATKPGPPSTADHLGRRSKCPTPAGLAIAAIIASLCAAVPNAAAVLPPITQGHAAALVAPEDPAQAHPAITSYGSGWTASFPASPRACALHILPHEESLPSDERLPRLVLRREWPRDAPCAGVAEDAVRRLSTRWLAHLQEEKASIATVDTILLGICGLLLALLPFAFFEAVRRLDRRTLLIACAAIALALLVRAIAPHRLVMVYFGYQHVGEAADLVDLPRYGPGATLLWWLLFRVFSPDHAAVQWLHAVLGSLTVGLCVAYVARATGGRLAPIGAGLFLALAPIFVREHNSESVAVPAMFAFAAAALLVAELLRTLTAAGSHRDAVPVARALAAVAVLTCFGALCRPDLAIAAIPMLLAASLGAARPGEVARLCVRAWPSLLACTAVAIPLICSVVLRSAADRELGNLPRLENYLAHLPHRLLHENALLHAISFPLLVFAPVVLGVFAAPVGRRALWLAGAAVFSQLPTFVDHNEVSILRLHAPAALWIATAAGLGLGALELRGRIWRAASVVLILGGIASMWPSVEPLFRERNPDQEDALQREAVAAIVASGESRPVLGRLGYGDLDIRDVHLHFPDYLLVARGIRPSRLRDLASTRVKGATFFLRSLRCYLWPGWNPKSPKGLFHPACARVCEEKACTPIFERDDPNLGDWSYFDGYGSAPTLRVGLYRVTER